MIRRTLFVFLLLLVVSAPMFGQNAPAVFGHAFLYNPTGNHPVPATGYRVFLWNNSRGFSAPSVVDSYGRYALYNIPYGEDYLLYIRTSQNVLVWKQPIKPVNSEVPTVVLRGPVVPSKTLQRGHTIPLEGDLANLAVFAGYVDPSAPFKIVVYQKSRDTIPIDSDSYHSDSFVEKTVRDPLLNKTYDPTTTKELKFNYLSKKYKLTGEVERRSGRNDFFHFEIFEDNFEDK